MKLIIPILLLSLTCHAEISPDYAGRLADAIKLAENSQRYPYGIIAKRPLSEPEARRWCLNTIRHQYRNWEAANKPGNFVSFLGKTYCPVGAKNDPTGLNSNWVKNVGRLFKK
jgi:hypothetical protein